MECWAGDCAKLLKAGLSCASARGWKEEPTTLLNGTDLHRH